MAPSIVDLQTSMILRAPPEQLWPLISDTSRVNRLTGIPPSERIEPDDMAQVIHSHYYGVPITWRETPFQWVFEQWFESERVFQKPMPVERVITRTELVPLDGKATRLEVHVRMVNRNPAGWLAARLVVGQKILGDLVRVYHLLETTAIAASKVPPPPPRTPSINTARLREGAERLRRLGLSPALIDLLAQRLRTADDMDVVKMRPFALADQWQEDRLEVLRLCLYATRSGLLDLEWDVLCPNCRGSNMRTSALSDLTRDFHCPACNVHYDLNFDESVELRFSVSPSLREAVDASYCVGGPANTRHILAQLRLPAHSTQKFRLRMGAGQYRLRDRQGAYRLELNVEQGGQTSAGKIQLTSDGLTSDGAALAAGVCELGLENTTDQAMIVMLEEQAWSAQAASAALVTALDEFRQLFSSEVLAPGLGLAVRNLTFLFSDLQDSTMMYDSIGDAPAYARVRDHFAVLRGTIGRWRGALVKTIGDAVMAVFPSSEDAMEAAIEIQREFTIGEITMGRPALRVKLGLHCGPCIAVNANELLDYFGSTVNVAARVQNQSLGGDIVITEEVLSDPGVRATLERIAPEVETFQRTLKGVRQEFTLYRLWLRDVEAATGQRLQPTQPAAERA